MKSSIRGLGLFGITLFVSIFGIANENDAPQSLLNYRFWNSSNGLPQNSVNSITQDSTGFIWFTTYDGIVRFDGKDFKVYNVKNTPSLPTNRWNCVIKGKGDDLYFFSYEGVVVHKKKGDFITQKVPLHNFFFTASLYDDALGALFVQDRTIYKIEESNIQPFFRLPDSLNISRISSIVKDPDSSVIYIGTHDKGLVFKYNIATDQFSQCFNFDGNIATLLYVKDRLLIVGRKKLSVIHEGEVVADFKLPDELEEGSSAIVSGEELFLSMKSAIFVYNLSTGSSYSFSPLNEALRYSLNSVYIDRDNSIWGGTSTGGLFQAHKKPFVFHDGFKKTGDVGVNPVFFDSKNRIQAGLNCFGIALINSKNEVAIRENILTKTTAGIAEPFTSADCIYAIFEDDRGDFWYGTADQGVYIERSSGELVYYLEELNDPSIKAIQQFGDFMYLGHSGGFSIYDLNSRHFVPVDSVFKNAELLKNRVLNYFYQLKNGDILVGTQKSGAFVLGSDQKIRRFINTAEIDVPNIRAVYEDSLGNVWIGTYGNGLLFCERGVDSVRIISKDQGLHDNVVSAIVKEGGDFYMTCNRGLYRVPIAELYGVLNGEITGVYCESFGSSRDYKQIEFNGGFQQTFARTNRGTILFPSFSGVVEFNPKDLPVISTPKISFIDVTVNGKNVQLDSSYLKLHHDFYSLSLRVSTPSYVFNQNLITEYRLKGFNEGWQSLRSDNIVEFNRLPHGSYVLEARVKHLSDLDDDYNYAQIKFGVEAPIWKRPENFAAFGSVLFLIIVLWFYTAKRKGRIKERQIAHLLKEKTGSLRETKANLEAVINNTDELIWCVDKNYNLLVANNAYLKVHRKKYGVELFRGESIFKNASPKTVDFWTSHFLKTLKGEKSKLQVQSRASSGRAIVNEVSFYPIYKDNEIAGLVGFTKEITGIKQREEQLKKAMQLAEDAARSKSEFLATMSHEIRTPINAVIGMTSLLQSTTLKKEQEEYVENIRFGGETLLQIINDILDFSKGEANKLTLEKYEFDIRESISNTVSLIEDRAAKKGLLIQRNIAEDVPLFARADESKLRQVLLNLLSNAVKFTEEGQIDISCSWHRLVNKKGKHYKLTISVSDTGIGIPKDKVKSLFSPFVQVDAGANRKYGGTGLGLAICKKIVERMGGEISINSEIGKGTNIEFWIACEPVENSHSETLLNEYGTKDEVIIQVNDDELRSKLEVVLKNANIRFLSRYNRHSPSTILVTDDMDIAEGFENVIYIGDELSNGCDKKMKIHPVISGEMKSQLPGVIAQLSKQIRVSSLGRSDDLEDLKNLNILIAEDNPVNQKLVQMILKKMGLSCDVVANGLEVIDAMERNKYNFVYMDCQMPEMDGFEATAAIRNKYDSDEVVIVAMTANAMKEDRLKCLSAGMNDYLAKPIDLEMVKKNLIKWSAELKKVSLQ